MSQLQLPSHLFGKRRSLFNWWSLWAGLRPLTGYQPYFCRSTCYETTLPSGRASSCSSSHRSNSSSRHRSSRRSSRRSSLPVWPVSCAYLLSCPPFSNSSLVQQRPPTPAAFTSSTCSSRHSGCSCVRRPSSFGGGAPPSPFGRWVGGGVKRLRCILGNFSGALFVCWRPSRPARRHLSPACRPMQGTVTGWAQLLHLVPRSCACR